MGEFDMSGYSMEAHEECPGGLSIDFLIKIVRIRTLAGEGERVSIISFSESSCFPMIY